MKKHQLKRILPLCAAIFVSAGLTQSAFANLVCTSEWKTPNKGTPHCHVDIQHSGQEEVIAICGALYPMVDLNTEETCTQLCKSADAENTQDTLEKLLIGYTLRVEAASLATDKAIRTLQDELIKMIDKGLVNLLGLGQDIKDVMAEAEKLNKDQANLK